MNVAFDIASRVTEVFKKYQYRAMHKSTLDVLQAEVDSVVQSAVWEYGPSSVGNLRLIIRPSHYNPSVVDVRPANPESWWLLSIIAHIVDEKETFFRYEVTP